MPNTPKAVSLLIALAFLLPAGESMAGSGKHKEIDIVNCHGYKLYVDSYNGDDKCGSVAHGGEEIKKGHTGTVRCHGKGKHRCYITLVDDKTVVGRTCEKIDLDKGKRLLIYTTSRGTEMKDGEPSWTQTKVVNAECDESRERVF